MLKQIPCVTIIVFGCTVFISSCVPQKRVYSHRQEIAALDSQLTGHRKNLKDLELRREKKQSDNEIDDTASFRIRKFISNAEDEIDRLVAKNSILIGDVEVDRSDWVKLKKTLQQSSVTSKILQDKVSLINDLINRNTVVKLDQDLLFEPGKYSVSTSVANSVERFFAPAAQEIDFFIKKYPDFPLSLVITAKGYADGTQIAEGSSLYNDLRDELKLSGKTILTNDDLNKALSNKRAHCVIELFQKFTKGRSSDGTNIRNIIFLHEGKGETFPNPKLTDYKADDPRRRVVLLFWGVFPD